MLIDLAKLSEDELRDLNRRMVERRRLMQSARQLINLAQFTVGMRVEFTADDGRILQGEITRLNRKTAIVCCTPSGHWRVRPALLRPVVQAHESSAPAARILPMPDGRARG